jgi:class 3 adenylate cyclase
MGTSITAYGGTLERFAGDGMMIFFNDPVLIPDPAEKGARMAIDMQRRFKTLQQTWNARNYSLSMGIGVAQGEATIGAIGFEGRRDYGAIGSVTNLAARLCSEAKPGQILASNKAVRNLKTDIDTRYVGALVFKGFADAVDCYEIVYPEAELSTANCDQLGFSPT